VISTASLILKRNIFSRWVLIISSGTAPIRYYVFFF
jgi:hypothetical protein